MVITREQPGCALSMYSDDLLNDPDPQVRLAAYLAFADSKAAADTLALEFHFRKLQNLDRWHLDAAVAAASQHASGFLRALAAKQNEEPSTDFLQIVRRVSEHYARSADEEGIGRSLTSLVGANPRVTETWLDGLDRGWPRGKAVRLNAEDDQALLKLYQAVPVNLRGAVASLAAKLGSKELEKYTAEISEAYLKQLADDKLDPAKRAEAAKQLVGFRRSDAKAIGSLLEVLTPRTPPELAAGILEAIGQSEADQGGDLLIASLAKLTPSTRQAAIRLLIARSAWTPALLKALDEGSIQLVELSLDQKQALANHPEKSLAETAKKLLARGGGLPNADRQKVVEELMPITKKVGTAAAGKVVFEKQCSKCHMHSGQGNKIGPDLTGMAVHPKAELLVHIIDPSRSVEGNYRVYTVAMDDGRVLTGLLASESKTAIELVDADAKRHTLVRDEIEEIVGSAKSLMPEGFEKQVTVDDLTNLLEFLTQRGKFTPLPLEKYATVVSTKGMFNSEEADVERLVFPDWSPKTVQGVPFLLVDPRGDRVANAIMLQAQQGTIPRKMPKSVTVPCNQPAKAIHLLSGVSGWGYPFGEEGSVTMVVRLKYEDGETEDHELLNGKHFADYIRRVDVPQSQFAFALRGQQIRYLAVQPKRTNPIKEIEFVKGKDNCVPVVMAITVEGLDMK
jgi:putative heme-binding domain-containing protein